MAFKVFPIPNFTNTDIDLVFADPMAPASKGIVHYAFTVGADKDAVERRSLPFANMQDFANAYGVQHPEILNRLVNGQGYCPGEYVLNRQTEPDHDSDHDAIMRLGALELLGNISSGRLAPTDKDPFPHQLALQQHVRKLNAQKGVRRILIADEVGLGKTIEAALILRDLLLARGTVAGFSCLYLTSGGLVEDAVAKIRDVLGGSIDGQAIVSSVESFRRYGEGNINGVYVASMHAARLYTGLQSKANLPNNFTPPQVIIIDECHHAASDQNLAGNEPTGRNGTQTYLAAYQLLTGKYWLNPQVQPPELAILMSATPFRSQDQFVNLLRLLTNGVPSPNGPFNAFQNGVQPHDLQKVLTQNDSTATVAWRMQNDPGVRSWSGDRIFPNLTIVRPHQVAVEDGSTPRLPAPSQEFLGLITQIKRTIRIIANKNGQGFGGFATAQLEKMLTSSSIAGACWLFRYAVSHCHWPNQKAYVDDQSEGTVGLRRLLRHISTQLAQANAQNAIQHATVSFPSDGFEFPATDIAPNPNSQINIYRFAKHLRDGNGDTWVADNNEIFELVNLSQRLLGLANDGVTVEKAQDTKLNWLNEMLIKHPNDRFILFTESLQTCETLGRSLGNLCTVLQGSMSKTARQEAVRSLRTANGPRVLVATSAADEGIDLQVASKVIHWDLSSSPATLMQRNGRAARLGQINNVVAYYLILLGTHEEKRDSSLQNTFAELGINNEAIKSRILGSLSEDEEKRLEDAIEQQDDQVVGDILKKAKKDNNDMDQQLAQIRKDLQPSQVLSRQDLAERLANWKAIGLPDIAEDIHMDFENIDWQKPVFGDDIATMEDATSQLATLRFGGNGNQQNNQRQVVAFDPEFLLFGPRHDANPSLAGIAPWVNLPDRHGKHMIAPRRADDLLSKFLHKMARLKEADFLTLPAEVIGPDLLGGDNVKWILFCTHPLRDAENDHHVTARPYLTYYAFSDLVNGASAKPINPHGAEADAVHRFIECAERYAREGHCNGCDDARIIQSAKEASSSIQTWVENVTQFGAIFPNPAQYYVPIPVCLVNVAR